LGISLPSCNKRLPFIVYDAAWKLPLFPFLSTGGYLAEYVESAIKVFLSLEDFPVRDAYIFYVPFWKWRRLRALRFALSLKHFLKVP